MRVLVTGGSGYIGSHTVLALLRNGHETTVVDNLSNSKIGALNRIEQLANKKPKFIKIDLLDIKELSSLFKESSFEAVIHFAGLKSVNESIHKPLLYYHNNIGSTLNLLKAMKENNVCRLVFSSSATVYGSSQNMPVDETMQTGIGIANPYGRSKFIIEQILSDAATSDNNLKIISLRYFNPVGADRSGLIGEDPKGKPNNLMPFITQVATGKLEELSIFGNDYLTPDGTTIRDYIHVTDLAEAHLKSLIKLDQIPGFSVINIGTGKGSSVLEMVKIFEKANSVKIPYKFAPRREGDVSICYASVNKAHDQLGWEATHSLEDMCVDAWRWQKMNPLGY